MAEFAEMADADHPLNEEQLYAVSIEGAIGLVEKYEFDLRWLFYPVLDEEVKAKYLHAVQEELKQQENVKQGQNSTGWRFCPNCGTKLNPGARFCPECGEKQ